MAARYIMPEINLRFDILGRERTSAGEGKEKKRKCPGRTSLTDVETRRKVAIFFRGRRTFRYGEREIARRECRDKEMLARNWTDR